MQTAGRYGVGLTLCILHSQRLIPGSCTMIRSALRSATHWTEARFVIKDDVLVCIKKERIPKRAKDHEISGTEVNLLVPGGNSARLAWPRLAEYFGRFQLSLGMKCSLEVMAPSLSRVPLYVRPPFELEQRRQRQRRQQQEYEQKQQQQQQQQQQQHYQKQQDQQQKQKQQEGENSNLNSLNDDQKGKDHVNDDEFVDIFQEQKDGLLVGDSALNADYLPSHEEDYDKENDHEHENGSVHRDNCLDLDENFLSSPPTDIEQDVDNSSPPTLPTQTSPSQLNVPQHKLSRYIAVKRQRQKQQRQQQQKSQDTTNIEMRQQMKNAVESYLQKTVDLSNVAHSKQHIRRPEMTMMISNPSSSSNPSQGSSINLPLPAEGPTLEIFMVVTNHDEEETIDAEIDPAEENENVNDNITTNESISSCKLDQSKARIMLIRMVNRIPMLDGVEASACGIVRGLLQKELWNSFGLEIYPTVDGGGTMTKGKGKDNSKGHRNSSKRLYAPNYSLGDSAHVAPFFSRSNTHTLFDGYDTDDSLSVQSDAVEFRSENSKRKRKTNIRHLKPAGLRLGNILIIVQLNAKSSQLQLPTLSKGRLPMNDVAINAALQAGLGACLRSLQKTNPSLLLTPSQLKKTERESLFIPSIASAFAMMALNCRDAERKDKMLSNIQCWGVPSRTQGCITNDEESDSHPVRLVSRDLCDRQSQPRKKQRELSILIQDRILDSLKNQEQDREQERHRKSVKKKKAKTSVEPTQVEMCENNDGVSSVFFPLNSKCDLNEFLSQDTKSETYSDEDSSISCQSTRSLGTKIASHALSSSENEEDSIMQEEKIEIKIESNEAADEEFDDEWW